MEAARELDTKGIKLYNSPTWQNDLVTDPLDVGKQQCGSLAFYIHDPEGNEIEIVQYTADSRQLKCRG